MKVTDHTGRIHEVTADNSLVTIFRKRVWKYLNHVFHLCHEGLCPVAYGANAHFFSQELVNMAQKQRFDELWKWEPDEAEHRAWEMYRNWKKLTESELNDFTKQLDQIDDKEIWDELGGLDES